MFFNKKCDKKLDIKYDMFFNKKCDKKLDIKCDMFYIIVMEEIKIMFLENKNKQPFIAISDYSVKKISIRAFFRFLGWVGYSARTKREFLSKYSEYSFCCSKERWLRFVKDICESNGFIYLENEWSSDYDEWKDRGCSYSIHLF